MTTKVSQPTTNDGQDAAELQEQIAILRAEMIRYFSIRRGEVAEYDKLRADIAGLLGELTEERQQRIEANALLLATALALGLDDSEVDELPQKACTILAEGSAICQEWDEKCKQLQWNYDEAMRQYDEAQKQAREAEAKLEATRTKAQKQSEIVQREWLSSVEAEGLRRKLEQTTRNALEANRRWKERIEVLEVAVEAGRLFWQEYDTLMDDAPEDVHRYFRRCNLLAGRFAYALKGLDEDEQ